MEMIDLQKLQLCVGGTKEVGLRLALQLIVDGVLGLSKSEEFDKGVGFALGCLLNVDEIDGYDLILELRAEEARLDEQAQIARWLSTEDIYRVEVDVPTPPAMGRVHYIEASSCADAAASEGKNVRSVRRATADDAEECQTLDSRY